MLELEPEPVEAAAVVDPPAARMPAADAKPTTYGLLVTSAQLRAARAFLGARLIDVAASSGLTMKVLWRSEQGGAEPPNMLAKTMAKLVAHYERSGVQFLNRDGGVGVLVRPVDNRVAGG